MNTEQNNKESTGKQVEKEILNGTGTAAGEDTREEIREEKNPIQVADRLFLTMETLAHPIRWSFIRVPFTGC